MFSADERLRRVMEDPSLDITHKQVLMALYSLHASRGLAGVRDHLPIYLSMGWNECVDILDTLERAGLLARSGDSVELAYIPEARPVGLSCGCG